MVPLAAIQASFGKIAVFSQKEVPSAERELPPTIIKLLDGLFRARRCGPRAEPGKGCRASRSDVSLLGEHKRPTS